MTVEATAGQAAPLGAEFIVGGVPADADAVELDITYGGSVGLVADYAGPFTLAAGQVTRTGTGQYAYTWQVPSGAPTGVYVANWTFTLDGSEWPATENVWVLGGTGIPVPAGDVGYWTGALIYAAADLDIEFGAVDATGTAWLWQGITGWDSAPVQGAGVIPRSGDHGGQAAPQYYAPRPMTLTCTASSPTQALRDQARATLQQAVPVSDLAILRYDEPVPKQCLVRRSGQLPEKYPTLCDVTFTVGLIAPDMRKYSTTLKSLVITPQPSGAGGGLVVPFTVPVTLDSAPPPGGGSVTNAGNFGSPPVVIITGPVTAPSLANLTTGETVSWPTLTLGASDVMVVDFLNRQAWANPSSTGTFPGASSSGGTYWPADDSSAWWVLPPGPSTIQLGGETGTGCTATVYFYNAWS